MTTDPSHGFEAMALRRVGDRGRIRGVASRSDTVAVAVDTDDRRRFLVIFQWDGSDWQSPELLDGQSIPVSPPVAPSPGFIPDLMITQVALPGPNRPGSAWSAAAGTIASDARRVIAVSDLDSAEAFAGSDGFFLLLLRCRWSARPHLTLSTQSGAEIDIQP